MYLLLLLALPIPGAVLASYFPKRAPTGLNNAAKMSGKLYFGTATDNGELTNTAYMKILNNTSDFGQITPGNSMKWDSIEPQRNTFTYGKGDVIANLAKANKQILRCHTLVWHQQLPSWVANGKFDNATLISILKNHITNVVSHYKGQCYAWDVVNEALNEDGSYRDSVFLRTIGPAYIPIAFAAAASADPTSKLYYNDFNIENDYGTKTASIPNLILSVDDNEVSGGSGGSGNSSDGSVANSRNKIEATKRIIQMIRAYGTKIDGVGLQSHLEFNSTPSVDTFTSIMNGFTALDVDVAITELDIRMYMNNISAAAQTAQANGYANAIKSCINVKRCVGITIWDFTDYYSWVPSTFPSWGSALPWDSNMVKKAMVYSAMMGATGKGSV